MIAFVFLNSFNDIRVRQLLDENKLLVYPTIMICFVVISLVLGYFDTKLGLRKEEMRNNAAENPVLMEILQHLKEIKGQKKQ